MRILLTGASGLIGSALHARLRADHEVVTAGRRASADVVVDLSDPAKVADLDLPDIDALVHCAGVVDEDFRDHPEQALRMAVLGAGALVSGAVAAGAQQLVYVSSAHVYGPMVSRIDEHSIPNPVSDYAIAHFATEQVFRRHAVGDIAGVALRPCAVFGDLKDPEAFRRWSLIPFSFPSSAVRDHAISIRSTGEQRRNFVGTEDIASSCAMWLDSQPHGWSAINPVGSVSASIFEFAKICGEVSTHVSGQVCEVSRVDSVGPTLGDDFEYQSVSPFAQGNQDLRASLERLMRAAVGVAE